jgi:hypothetical protein
MMATIMKHRALISLLFILFACSSEGTMYLFSGSGACGHGLSYPGYGSPLSLASEFRFINQSYYHPILPLWDQFTFYLPFPAVKDFRREDWKPATADYDTPAVRQFMQEDGYREGVEQHNDPDRMGLNHFLDDDEPPGRPLL